MQFDAEKHIKENGLSEGWLPVYRLAAETAERGGILALDGRCASGKTTLANRLGEVFGCPVFHLDDFFLRPEQRSAARYGTPGGNVDYERFESEVLAPFAKGEAVSYRRFDCHEMALAPTALEIPAAGFAVVEGCYAMNESLRKYYAASVFVTHEREKQYARIEARSGAERLEVFKARWIPLEELYFEGIHPEQYCDLILDTTELF